MKNDACVCIANRPVGVGHPVFVIAEIGINHNGSVEIAKQLIDGAKSAGCDAVKFQKRTPDICVPENQWALERDTPWGRISYIDYRRKMEFGRDEYAAIDQHCRSAGIVWFASCWDEASVEFIEGFDPPCYKVASACLTDLDLLRATRATRKPLMLSTGMSSLEQIDCAVETVGTKDLLIAHTTSIYPCPVSQLNLRTMETLSERFPGCPIGYSGHETGLATTWAAVARGATFVERHVTLDRAMWGTDQAASVEIHGMKRLVSNIRDIEVALGDGVKRVYPDELKAATKLRPTRILKEDRRVL